MIVAVTNVADYPLAKIASYGLSGEKQAGMIVSTIHPITLLVVCVVHSRTTTIGEC